MTANTTALVQRLREALDWCVAEINRDSPSSRNAKAAIAAADQWLAEQPTNQCGETCERAKLCATCARELSLPLQQQQPLTDDQWQRIADVLDCIITREQKDEIDAVIAGSIGQPSSAHAPPPGV